MQINDHLLTSAIQLVSPNCDERPDPDDISLLVIHCISLPPGQFGGDYIRQLFQNCLDAAAHPYFENIYRLKVSAHLLIRRDGSQIQFVPFNRRAWHAGVSSFRGRERCNDFSIGIELEGTDDQPYTESQYLQLAAVITTLLTHYPHLDRNRIVGHSDIAPGRKTDPGAGFEWDKLDKMLQSA